MESKEISNERVKAFRQRKIKAGMVQRTYFIKKKRAGQIEEMQRKYRCNVNDAMEMIFQMAFGEERICPACDGYGCEQCKGNGWIDARIPGMERTSAVL